MRYRYLLPLFLLLVSISFAQQTFYEGMRELVLGLVTPVFSLVFPLLIFTAAAIYALAQTMPTESRAKLTVWSTNVLVGVILAAVLFTILMWLVDPNVIEATLHDHLPEGLRIEFIVLSLTFSAILVGVFYMVAAVFQHPPLDVIKQEELAAFLMTFLIVLGWGFLYFTFGNLTQNIICMATEGLCDSIGTFQASHVDLAYFALDSLFVRMRTIYVQLYLFEVLIGFLSTISFPIGSPLPGLNIISLTFNPFDGLVLLSNAHTVLVEAVGYAMMVLIAKEHLLLFARDAVPMILLPIGILMRSFPWFRTTGSSLIALCVVAYFVYPLAILLSNYLIFDAYHMPNFAYVPSISDSTGAGLTRSEVDARITAQQQQAAHHLEILQSGQLVRDRTREVCGSGISGFLCGVGNFVRGTWGVVKGFFVTLWDIGRFIWYFAGDFTRGFLHGLLPTGAVGGLFGLLIWELVSVSQLVILVIFTSVLEIIITITSYRSIASLTGGEIEIAGLTKLV